MAAPKKANPGPGATARRQIGLETAAVKLRTAGRDDVEPPTPTRHFHDGIRCWTPTLCAGRETLAKLRELATEHDDAQLTALVDQLAEHFPAEAQ